MNMFHKLPNNESDFPLIENVNVYKYDNKLDYARFNAEQMTLQICNVPWDVGEARIGTRSISGIGNVVFFETKEKRNAWFDAIPSDKCFRFSTKFKELHRDKYIDVPIPFDVCARFNYLRVVYNLFANDDSPVQYESSDGVREWFWFIREVELLAPNTTRLHLLDDAFQTWIYDLNVSSMVLERGHAPMFAMRADRYLNNPVNNNTDLLAPDVSFGEATQVAHIESRVFNVGDMYACIATTANPVGAWGSKDANNWSVPASGWYMNNGVPSVYVMAMKSGDLSTFLDNVTAQVPQFKQTIQGIFFASSDLLDLPLQFTFAGVTCYGVSSARKTMDFCRLDKSQFGFGDKYEDIAKLYTSPYSHLEIVDDAGNTNIVKIEDTNGDIKISAALSLAYPFINIDAHLLGAGGSGSATLTFSNVDSRSFPISGKWYENLRTWQIPMFAVVLESSREYDYSTHFDRAQRVVDYETAYSNATASASNSETNANISSATDKANADASADTLVTNTGISSAAEKANTDASADTLVTNTAVQVAANAAINSRSNESAYLDTTYSNLLSQALQAWESGYARQTVNNQVDAAYASAAIGAAGSVANAAISGASAGPIGAIGGLISGAISGATSLAQTAISANLTSTQAEAGIALSQQKVSETSTNNSDRTSNQVSANTDVTSTSNNANTASSANNAATAKANAARTSSSQNSTAANNAATAKANAARTNTSVNTISANTRSTQYANAGRSRAQAQSAIDNSISQAALRAPYVFGSFADGDTAATRPQALLANVVTQSKSAISAVGDEFLRYGYMYGRQWEFSGNWNIGKYFTYWKLSDFWVKDLAIPDMYVDRLRFFLLGGVTIWRRPEDIGKVSIYDNFKE